MSTKLCHFVLPQYVPTGIMFVAIHEAYIVEASSMNWTLAVSRPLKVESRVIASFRFATGACDVWYRRGSFICLLGCPQGRVPITAARSMGGVLETISQGTRYRAARWQRDHGVELGGNANKTNVSPPTIQRNTEHDTPARASDRTKVMQSHDRHGDRLVWGLLTFLAYLSCQTQEIGRSRSLGMSEA